MKHYGLMISAVALLAARSVSAAVSPVTLSPGFTIAMSSHSANPQDLRGYGPVDAMFYTVRGGKSHTRFSLMRFIASNHTNAETIAGKFLADITLSPGVVSRAVTANGRAYRVVEVQNGPSYTALVSGKTTYVLSGPSTQALSQLIAANPIFAAAALDAQPASYPRFLDRFDRYGWGFYGMAGLQNEFGWMDKPGTDPIDDVEFCAKYNLIYDLWLNAGGIPEALGLRYWSEIPWKLNEANKRGLPVSSQLYGWVPYTPQYASAFEFGARFLQEGWYGGGLEYKAERHHSWFSPQAADYMARQTQGQMRPLVNKPLFLGWMEPLGETSPGPWLDEHRDFSQNAVQSWIKELRDNQHFTLAQVSKMYERADAPFTTWNQVPVPTYDVFAGWDKRVADLGGIWYCRQEAKQGDGVVGLWWNDDHSSTDWLALNMPGDDNWTQLEPNNRGNFKWCTHTFTLTAAQLVSDQPIYLYEFLRPENYGHVIVTPMYINGQKAGDVGPWGALEVRSLLHIGDNRIDLETTDWSGRVYLSTDAPAVFPHLSREQNRMYVVWTDWLETAHTQSIATNLSAMRRVDPNRPIKMMAPGEGQDNWLSLGVKYGAYGHFTGEGVWMYPWYKRYGYLYDLPGSSEGAGPSNNANDEFLTFQRIFLEGLNSHVDVFDAQMFTRVPELRAWYESHMAMLKQLGRYDIAGPQVLIYRPEATNRYQPPNTAYPKIGGPDAHEVQTTWNWDIGRGSMQTLGQSSLYISDNGLRDNKLKGYKILVDGGNPFLGTEAVSRIKKWVAAGGTYITWPFTGESDLTQADTWPVNALTGCTVKALRTPGTGTVTFVPGEKLLPGWGGRSFADDGKCIEWTGRNNNQVSTELTPGPNCTVVARFENGSPAIVVHQVGAGRVIALGSAFFHNVGDRMGIWWPEPIETDFWKSLLDTLGQPSVNTTSDRMIWPQRYRMNNGVDDVVIVNNFADADRSFTLTTTLDSQPSHVYRVSQNTITSVPFSMVNGKVVVQTSIPKSEVQAYLFRTHDAADAAQYWWNYQQRMWKPTLKTGGYELPKGAKPWVDPTVDLMYGWKWTQDPAAAGNNAAPWNDTNWKTAPLDIMTFVGADSTKTIYMRRHFQIPANWLQNGKTIFGQGPTDRDFYLPGEQGQVYLNGTLVHDWANQSTYIQDVQPLLHTGDNIIAFNLKPGTGKYLGVAGATYLVHQAPPLQTIDLAGVYQAKRDGKSVEISFPGIVNCSFPNKQIPIPADWKDKYEIAIYLRGAHWCPDGIWVNDRYYHHRPSRANECEIDISPLLNYGQINTISPSTGWNTNVKQVTFDVASIELRLYPKSN